MAMLNVGTPMDPVAEPVLVRFSAWGEEPTDFMERPFVVVSERMRAALEQAGVDNIQYFKAQLQRERSTQVEQGYWLANIIGKLACVDPLASKLDSVEGAALPDLPSFVIDPARTCGFGLFRLAEDPRMIIAGPHVQVALQAAKLRGVLFQDPASYNGGRAICKSELDSHRRSV
jgi:hypothetical protein